MLPGSHNWLVLSNIMIFKPINSLSNSSFKGDLFAQKSQKHKLDLKQMNLIDSIICS